MHQFKERWKSWFGFWQGECEDSPPAIKRLMQLSLKGY